MVMGGVYFVAKAPEEELEEESENVPNLLEVE